LFLRCSTTSIKTGVSGPFNLHTTLDATHKLTPKCLSDTAVEHLTVVSSIVGRAGYWKERRLRAKERQQLEREGKTLKKTSPAGETLKREDNRVRHS